MSVCTPLCFAIIPPLSPNTHIYTHIQRLMCPDSAFIEPVLVNIATSWPVKVYGTFPCVLEGTEGHGCSVAWHCNIYGGRCESVTTASCAQCCTHIQSHRHKMIKVTTYNNEAHRKSITIHPLITMLHSGSAPSPFLSLSPLKEDFVATFPALPRESAPAAAAPHDPKPQSPISSTTAADCVLTSLAGRHARAARTSTYALPQRRHSQDD